MSKKDQLAPLITSLTPSEKKYFVQFVSLRSDDKKYMKLYYCVLRDKKYEPEKLSKELKKTKANLAHDKEYLIENILKALRSYNDKLPAMDLLNKLAEVELLNKRALPDLAYRQLQKAAIAAQSQGRHEILWHIDFAKIALQEMLFERKGFFKESVKNIGQMRARLQWMSTFTDLQELLSKTLYSYNERVYNLRDDERAESLAFLAHPLLNKKFTEPGFELIQCDMKSSIYQQMNEREKCVIYSSRAVKILEQNPQLVPADGAEYFYRVHALITPLLANPKNIEIYRQWLHKIEKGYYKKLPFASARLDAMFETYLFGYYLGYYNFTMGDGNIDREAILAFLKRFEESKEKLLKLTDPIYWQNEKISVANLYLHLGMYAQSLDWVNSVINDINQRQFMTILQGQARMMAVILHFESGNISILSNLIKSTRRFLRGIQMYTRVEQEMLDFIISLARKITKRERQAAFGQLVSEYHLMESESNLLLHLRMFNYRLWAKRNAGYAI